MKKTNYTQASSNLQTAAALLAGMLRQAVSEALEGEANRPPGAQGRPPDLKRVKEMTAILKDLTGVMGTWQEPEQGEQKTGVVLLPPQASGEGEAAK